MKDEPKTNIELITQALNLFGNKFKVTDDYITQLQKNVLMLHEKVQDLETQMNNIMHHPRIKKLEEEIKK